MSDCGVCLSGSDYGSNDFYEERIVKGRKDYFCCECNRDINKGDKHEYAVGKSEGSIHTHRTCLDCMNIRDAFNCDGGFLFGSLWDSLSEYSHELNTGCLAKIKTPSAKGYFLEQLREFRGIEW